MLWGIGSCRCADDSVGDDGRSLLGGIADLGISRTYVLGDFLSVCLGCEYSADVLCRNRRGGKARNIGERQQILGDVVEGEDSCL